MRQKIGFNLFFDRVVLVYTQINIKTSIARAMTGALHKQ